MYGTIFRMKVKPGAHKQVAEHFGSWLGERAPGVKGAQGGLLMKPDGLTRDLLGIAVFEDKANYEANAADPAQHEWYLKLRELLESDPDWEDGEYLAGSLT